MIKDSVDNVSLYFDTSRFLKVGLEYINSTDFNKLECGRYEILGDNVYAVVQDYLTKPEAEGTFEAHRKYIDIQYVVAGEEKIGIDNINSFVEQTPYDEGKDIV